MQNIHIYVLIDGGFAGPIRMFLDDAEIKYEYNVIEREQWQSVKAKYIEEGLPFDCVPMIELDGKRYSGTQPILRFLSKKLGKFEGLGREESVMVISSGRSLIQFCN